MQPMRIKSMVNFLHDSVSCFGGTQNIKTYLKKVSLKKINRSDENDSSEGHFVMKGTFIYKIQWNQRGEN